MDQLGDLDDGLAMDVEQPVLATPVPPLVRSVALHDALDEGLAADTDDDALTPNPTFCPPESRDLPVPFTAPPLAFLVLMVFVGATAAALVFYRQVAQLF